MQWFGVALWSRWPPPTSVSFPEHMGMVEARSAFAAIEMFMRSCGLVYVAYAAADAMDGSTRYRCHKPLVGAFEEMRECV